VTALRLGDALVQEGLMTGEQLKLVLERQVIFGGKIGTNIVELRIMKEEELAVFLSKFFKVPAVDASLLDSAAEETIACISRKIADKYKVVPFKKERHRLHVAMLNPRSMAAVDELRFITGYDVIPYVVTELRLLHALEKYYGIERDLRYISTFGHGEEERAKTDADDHKEHMRKVKEAFVNAREKDEVIGLLLDKSGEIASRAAIFTLKGGNVKGWRGRGLDVSRAEIAIVPHSLFSDAIGRKSHYRGSLPEIPENEPLISLLSGVPQDCLLIPIMIRDKVIGLLYADNGNQRVMDASLNYIHTLVTIAQLSFQMAILRKKIMDL
jgi:hypothetical protein